jgi:ribosomal protein S25
MPDEPVPDAPTPDVAPVEQPQPAPEPAQGEVSPLEAPTAQIPANEPLAPASEPLPSQPSTPISGNPIASLARALAAKARAVIQSRKRAKLDKVMEAITKHGAITNDQVEKLLHVSDATATRYLAQLEKEGKVQQVGKTGKSVKYQKV